MLVQLALRNVIRNKSRFVIGTAIIAVSCLLLVVATGQIAGVNKTLRSSMVDTITGHIQIKPSDAPKDFFEGTTGRLLHYINEEDTTDLLSRLNKVEGVNASSARLRFGALIGDSDDSSGATITAVDPETIGKVTPDLQAMLPALSQNIQAAYVSKQLLEKAELEIGGEIFVLTETPSLILNGRPYDIGGYAIAPVLIDEYMSGMFLTDLSSARKMLFAGDISSEILIRVEPEYEDSLNTVIERIQEALTEKQRDYLSVYSFLDVAKGITNVSAIAKGMAGIQVGAVMFVMFVILLIFTKLSLHERRSEIGTLVSLGMTNTLLTSLFLLEVVIKVVIGYFIGFVAAIIILSGLKHAGGIKSETLVEQFMNGGKVMLPVFDFQGMAIGFLLIIFVSILTTLFSCMAVSRETAVSLLASNQ